MAAISNVMRAMNCLKRELWLFSEDFTNESTNRVFDRTFGCAHLCQSAIRLVNFGSRAVIRWLLG